MTKKEESKKINMLVGISLAVYFNSFLWVSEYVQEFAHYVPHALIFLGIVDVIVALAFWHRATEIENRSKRNLGKVHYATKALITNIGIIFLFTGMETVGFALIIASLLLQAARDYIKAVSYMHNFVMKIISLKIRLRLRKRYSIT